ncbi:hypothetical protein [Zunongwangia endophytica]|uniref:Uncharacterized protein n=1 Tax=Zunongwangia endophytica TaxID=1808945 RepID=A0ABV8HBL3_9FLAO|nr:hypothetical protein [Zunongwangia endophytica]MDN3594650.1 hypothetical protein [Zunongwangia endophytica]
MDLYIDKENTLSFIDSREDELYIDCEKLLKKQLDVKFNFPKEDLQADPKLMKWFQKNFTQGVSKSMIYFDTGFPEKPLKPESTNTFNIDQLSSVYLLDDKDVPIFKVNGNIMIGGVGEEINTLQNLFFNQRDYLFDKTWKIGSNSFQKWSDLEPFSLPLTDILIVDPYVLCSQADCHNNLLPFLKSLVKCTKAKIDIVIYTNKEKCIDYNIIAPVLKTTVKNITGTNPNLTIVTYTDRRGVPSRGEHDRTILMNYKRIKSGDTFNYFKSDGSIQTKGRELQYLSLARRENHELAKELINDLQGNVDFFKRNHTNINGDKKSNFLNFN